MAGPAGTNESRPLSSTQKGIVTMWNETQRGVFIGKDQSSFEGL